MALRSMMGSVVSRTAFRAIQNAAMRAIDSGGGFTLRTLPLRAQTSTNMRNPGGATVRTRKQETKMYLYGLTTRSPGDFAVLHVYSSRCLLRAFAALIFVFSIASRHRRSLPPGAVVLQKQNRFEGVGVHHAAQARENNPSAREEPLNVVGCGRDPAQINSTRWGSRREPTIYIAAFTANHTHRTAPNRTQPNRAEPNKESISWGVKQLVEIEDWGSINNGNYIIAKYGLWY
jgi:hypothetical protein